MPPADPARRVVAREDATQIVLDQGADQRKGLLGALLIRLADLASLKVLAEERGVPAEDDASGLGEVDHEGLMTRSVSGGGHHLDAARDPRRPRRREVGELG